MKKYTVDTLRNMVNELNGWDLSFDHLEAYHMSEFNDYMHGQEPEYIANRIFYGEFNPNHDYFRFDGYGNLESFNEYDLEAELQEHHNEIIEAYTEAVEDGLEDYEDLLEVQG